MSYWNEKFFGTHWHGVWLDYTDPDSVTCWIIKKSQGFTDTGLLRISESVKAYAYLILSLQTSARFSTIENTSSALTAQKAFLNNFKNVANCRVDIQKTSNGIKTPLVMLPAGSITAWGEGIYMLLSNMNLNIRSGTAGYKNEV